MGPRLRLLTSAGVGLALLPPALAAGRPGASPDDPAAGAYAKNIRIDPAPPRVVPVRPAGQVAKAPVAQVKRMPAAKFNLEASTNQYVLLFRAVARAEYGLIRAACDLSEEERARVAVGVERGLKRAATEFAEVARSMAEGNRTRPYPDPRKATQAAVLAAMEGTLSPPQLARYREESARRSESRRRVAVANIVLRVDDNLRLSTAQREAITRALFDHWDDSWSQGLEPLAWGDQLSPNIPDRLVVPSLDPLQAKIWAGLPRGQVQYNLFNSLGGVQDASPIDQEDAAGSRRVAVGRPETTPTPPPVFYLAPPK